MKKQILEFEVISNRRVSPDHFILSLKPPVSLHNIQPGQFVQVLIPDTGSVYLRRPISIHDIDPLKGYLSMLIQIKGQGTRRLSLCSKGDILNLIVPLGNCFSIIRKERKVLLAGGGCGLAPLLFLARRLKESKKEVHILAGAKCTDYLIEMNKYSRYGKVHISTEDGSSGERGLITGNSVLKGLNSSSFDRIYCCGPEPMMKAVSKIAQASAIPCEVSLENTMACGIGACLCCVTDTIYGHKCVCTEGPVFDSKVIKWQI